MKHVHLNSNKIFNEINNFFPALFPVLNQNLLANNENQTIGTFFTFLCLLPKMCKQNSN